MHFLSYPAEEAVAIVTTASEITGLPASAILEDFSAFLGARLFEIYKPLIDPEWRTLDLVENVEPPVLQAVRAPPTAS